MYFTGREIEAVLLKVVDLFLIPRFRELGMNATGEWMNSLEVVANNNDSGSIRGRQYSEQLAKGRQPGKRPPIAPIEKWVTAKFGISGNQAKSMAFAISHKIANEGTTWYQKGGSDLIEVLEEPRVLEFIQNELGGILQVKLAEQIVRDSEHILSGLYN